MCLHRVVCKQRRMKWEAAWAKASKWNFSGQRQSWSLSSAACTPSSPWTAFLQARSFIPRGKMYFIINYNVPHERKESIILALAGLHLSKMKVPSKYGFLKQQQWKLCHKVLCLLEEKSEGWQLSCLWGDTNWKWLVRVTGANSGWEQSPSLLELNTDAYRYSRWLALIPSPSTSSLLSLHKAPLVHSLHTYHTHNTCTYIVPHTHTF